jgi:hypothetical protein
MISSSLQINRFLSYFRDRLHILKSDIRLFYQQTEPQLSTTTLNWRIHCLIAAGILKPVSRGCYQTCEPKKFMPGVSRHLSILAGQITKKLPSVSVCIWETAFFIPFMSVRKNIVIIEAGKNQLTELKILLTDLNTPFMYKPTHTELHFMKAHIRTPHILFPLISGSPVILSGTIPLPTLEKMMVDILCYPELFQIHHMKTHETIFKKISEHHDFDVSKMIRYAGRRNKTNEVKSLVKTLRS